MHKAHGLVGAVGAGVLLLGCQDFLPANIYDPEAPASEQKAAALQVTVVLQDARLDAIAARAELDALTVRLTGVEPAVVKTARCDGDGAAVLALTCDAAAHRAQVRFAELRPGDFGLEVQGVDPRYLPAAIPAITLLPGEERVLPPLTFVAPTPGGEPGTGRVEGEVALSSGSGGAPHVELYQLVGGQPRLVTAAIADPQGRFAFGELDPGTYAVAAQLDRYTPDYRTGFSVQRGVSVEQNTVRFEGAEALRLFPVSAVLIPALQQTFGEYYTSGDRAPVQVLQFGGMNEMRVATEDGFASGTPAWLPYAATVDVDLPAREGPVRVLAQFRTTQTAGLEFETGYYEARVIRDVTPPAVVATSLRGHSPGAQGRIWIAQDAALLAVDVDAQDAVSGVYGLAVYHDAAGGAGDPASLPFALLEAPPGLIRVDTELGLSQGDGEKTVHVYLRDRAGNTSAPAALSAWVDTAPPGVSLELTAATTGSALVPVRVLASDDHGVVSMQIWEEGQPVPAPVPVAEQWSVQLVALDYANTGRQLNALVTDVAGNTSPPFATTLTFDDRGALAGTLRIEDATDGSAGDAAGVVALVNGQSFAAQFTAAGERGAFDVVVPGIPAADNLQLELQKAGYGAARSVARYTVRPGVTTAIEALSLRLARGSIAGVARLDSGQNHGGIVVSVQGTALAASTDPLGAFRIDDVPAATGYTLTFRFDDDHTTEQRTGVAVLAGQVTQVSSAANPVLLATLQGGVAIAEGNYTNQRTIQLVLSFEGAVEFRASEDAAFTGAAYRAFADAATGCVAQGAGSWRCPFSLADRDGGHRVYVQFRDPGVGGFESDLRSDTITLDRVLPAAGSVELAGGAVAVKVLNVEAVLASSDDNGVASMLLSTDGTSFASPVPLHSPIVQTFAGAEGSKCLHARFVDVAGNLSALPAAFDCIDYDITPPTGSLAIVDADNQDLSITNQPGAYLRIGASGAPEMMLSSRSDFAGAAWQPVNVVDRPYWAFEPGQGTRWVYLALRDAAGNVAQGQPALQDSVQVDTVAPPAPVFTVREGAFTNQLTIHLDLANPTPGETVLFESSRALGTVQTQPATNAVSFTLPALDGLHLVQVRYRDPAGNVSTASTASITLDRSGPLFAGLSCATCATAAGQVLSTQSAVTLVVQGGDAAQLRVSGDVSSSTSWQAYSTLVAVTLSPGDGLKYVQVELRDAAGNSSTPSSDDLWIRVDSPADGEPVTGTLVVTGVDKDGPSSARTRDRLVLATTAGFGDGVQGSGLTHLQISEDSGFAGAVWQECPLASSCNTDLMVALSTGDGDKTLRVRVRDAAGNISAAVPAGTIRLDTAAPSLTVVLEGQVAGGAPSTQYTRVSSVRVRVTASDSGSGLSPVTGLLRVSNDPTFAAVTWRDLGDVASWTLPSFVADGPKRVYTQVQDLAGNVAQADASIVLDTRGPSGRSVLIDGDAAVTDATGNHTLSLAAVDTLSGVSQMCVSNTSTCSAWETFADQKTSWSLASGAGKRTVYAWFRDAAGNELGPVSDDIVVDLAAPSAASFTVQGFSGACLAGGSNWVTSTGVTVSMQASDDVGIVSYKLAEDSNFGAVSWLPWPGSGAGPYAVSHLLSSSEGPKTLGLRVLDAAERTFDAATVCVTLDSAPPVLGSVEILGGEFASSPDVTVRVTASDSQSTGANLKLALGNELLLCGIAGYARDFTGCTGTPCTADFAWSLNATEGTRRVVACVRDAAGRIGNVVSDTVILDLTDPPQVPDLQLVSGSRQVTASWSVVTDAGSGVDHYELNYAPTSDFSGARAKLVNTGALAAAEVTDLDNRIPYYFRVRAVDRAARTGPWSEVKQTVLGFAGVRLGELEHWRMFNNFAFAQPGLSTAGGRLWLTGTRSTVMGVPWTLEVYSCDPRVADCRQPGNWNRVGGDSVDLFVGGQGVPMRVPVVELGGRIYIASPTTLAGVRRVMAWMCFTSSSCLDPNDWATVQIDIDSDADPTNDISPNVVDLISTGSRVVVVYEKALASTTYPVVASCPATRRCDAPANWTRAHLTGGPTALPWVGGNPTLASDSQRLWLAWRTGTGGYDLGLATCALTGKCDAAGDFTTYTLGAVLSGSAEYYPVLARTPARLYLAWYSTSNSKRIRLARCDLSSACNAATDWTLGEFVNPPGSDDAVPSLRMDYAYGALQATWWDGNEGAIYYGYCPDPDLVDCLDPTPWTRFPLDQNVLLSNAPDVVWFGHNPLLAYQEDGGYVRLQLPRAMVPVDMAAAPGAGEFRAAWTGLAYLDGYHLVHDGNGPPSWTNTLLLPDPLLERAQVNSPAGAEQVVALRSLFDGEVSDDSRAQQVRPFREVVAVASTRTYDLPCGGSGTSCNVYTLAANASTLYAAYKGASSPYNLYVTRCVHATSDCTQAANWSTPIVVNTGAARSTTLLATDSKVYLVESSSGNAVYYTACTVSTGCATSGDWSAVLTLAGLGQMPAITSGNGRVLMVTRNSGTGQLYAHYCLDSADCTQAANWTQNVVIDAAVTSGGFDVVATTSGFSVVREYASAVNYRHCRTASGCESSSDWSTYVGDIFPSINGTPATHSARIATSTTPPLQLVTSVHEGSLWVALCNSTTSTCGDADLWAPVKLDAVSDLKGLTVQPQIANGVLTVLYSTLNEMRLATCKRDCHRRESWHIAPVLRTPELRESYLNRPVFSVVNGDRLVVGYELDTTVNYPLSVLWDGLAVPLE